MSLHQIARARADLVGLPEGFELPTSQPGSISDDLGKLRRKVDRALDEVDTVAEELAGQLEETDARPASKTGPAQLAADPVPLPRSMLNKWTRALGKANKLLGEALADDGLTSIEIRLEELPEIDSITTEQVDDLVELREGVADLVAWALEGGADPADLGLDCPASVRELVRQTALLWIKDHRPAAAQPPATPSAPVDGVDAKGDVVARRLVMRREVWDELVGLAEELKARRGIEVAPTDVAAIAIEAGMAEVAKPAPKPAPPVKRGPGFLRPVTLDEDRECERCNMPRELRMLAVYEDAYGFDVWLCTECGLENPNRSSVAGERPPGCVACGDTGKNSKGAPCPVCADRHPEPTLREWLSQLGYAWRNVTTAGLGRFDVVDKAGNVALESATAGGIWSWLRETGQHPEQRSAASSAAPVNGTPEKPGDLPGTATVLIGGKHVAGPAPTVPEPIGAPGIAEVPPSLDRFAQTLRPYQQALVDDALAFVTEVDGMDPTTPEARRRRLYSMPTGTGKGTAQLALLKALRAAGRDAWIVTPSLEVLRGYLERCGAGDLEGAGEARLAQLGELCFCTTTTRMRNRILDGSRGGLAVVLYDEVHHAIEGNDVSGTLFALMPLAAWIGFTATPYRGSPRGTLELEKAWPDQVEVLNIPEAVAMGAWALPTFEVVGLVDDDQVKIQGGDFHAKAAGELVGSRIEDLAKLIAERSARWKNDDPRLNDPERDVPTAVTVPNREAAGFLVEALDRWGVPARLIDTDTSAAERARAYTECREGKGVLVSVRVLAEGVDFPWLRRLIDARPTLSPVSWLQQVGRITRPGPVRPEYICVCRNLERHAYLLQGMVPRKIVAQAQDAFELPSKRGGQRAVGLEALTKFKQIDLPLADGVRGAMYALYSVDESSGVCTEWAVLLDPTSERAITARRLVTPQADGSKGYGKWAACPLPTDLNGYATSGFRGKVSDKQGKWWQRAAARHGLDPAAVGKLTQRQFCALPVLSDLRMNLRAEVVAAEAGAA